LRLRRLRRERVEEGLGGIMAKVAFTSRRRTHCCVERMLVW